MQEVVVLIPGEATFFIFLFFHAKVEYCTYMEISISRLYSLFCVVS